MNESTKEPESERSMGALEAATEGVKIAVKAYAPGLTFEKFFADVGAEFKLKNVQATAELAQALFTGGSYVPYGRGQSAPKDHDHEQPAQTQENAGQEQPQQERGGRGM
jgi:hypothetical protein